MGIYHLCCGAHQRCPRVASWLSEQLHYGSRGIVRVWTHGELAQWWWGRCDDEITSDEWGSWVRGRLERLTFLLQGTWDHRRDAPVTYGARAGPRDAKGARSRFHEWGWSSMNASLIAETEEVKSRLWSLASSSERVRTRDIENQLERDRGRVWESSGCLSDFLKKCVHKNPLWLPLMMTWRL